MCGYIGCRTKSPLEEMIEENVGLGNMVAASRDLFPKDFLQKSWYSDLIELHNSAKAGSRIRREIREELFRRNLEYYTWFEIYFMKSRPKTALRHLAAEQMILEAADREEALEACKAAWHYPDLSQKGIDALFGNYGKPEDLRYIAKNCKYHPELAQIATEKLSGLVTA